MLRIEIALVLALLLLIATPALAADVEAVEPGNHVYAALEGPNGEKPLFSEQGAFYLEPVGFHAVAADGPGIDLGCGWCLSGEFRLRFQSDTFDGEQVLPRGEINLSYGTKWRDDLSFHFGWSENFE